MTKALRTAVDAPQALPVDEVLARLGVSASRGLADEEVRHRLKVFGSNTVVSTRKASGLVILLHQFQSLVVYLLSAAAALAFYFDELEEGAAIAAVLGLNALIGFLTELKAARGNNRCSNAFCAAPPANKSCAIWGLPRKLRKTHRARVLHKLNARTTVELLVRKAIGREEPPSGE